jgi:membrane dipeptidase
MDAPGPLVEGGWCKVFDYGEGSADNVGFPAIPDWFGDNRDFGNIRAGLEATSLTPADIDGIM